MSTRHVECDAQRCGGASSQELPGVPATKSCVVRVVACSRFSPHGLRSAHSRMTLAGCVCAYAIVHGIALALELLVPFHMVAREGSVLVFVYCLFTRVWLTFTWQPFEAQAHSSIPHARCHMHRATDPDYEAWSYFVVSYYVMS